MCDRYSCIFYLIQHKPHWKRRLNIKYPFSYTWFLKTKWRQRQTFKRHYVAWTSYIRVQRFSRTKASVKWSVTATTIYSVMTCMQIRAQFRLFQVKAMFKQHVNLMIWTSILWLQTASRKEFPCKNGCLNLPVKWLTTFISSGPCCLSAPLHRQAHMCW